LKKIQEEEEHFQTGRFTAVLNRSQHTVLVKIIMRMELKREMCILLEKKEMKVTLMH